MAQLKAVTANAYKNNGATILMAGAASTTSGPITNAPGKSILGHGVHKGNVVPGPASAQGTLRAWGVGEGTWGLLDQFIIKGGNITSTLATVSYTGLASGANPIQSKSIKDITSRSTVHITSWAYATGVATKGANTSDDFSMGQAAGTDHAVTSRTFPGELVYLTGKIAPTQDDYDAKTGV